MKLWYGKLLLQYDHAAKQDCSNLNILGAILVRLCQGLNWFWRRDCGFKFELGPADGPATFCLLIPEASC